MMRCFVDGAAVPQQKAVLGLPGSQPLASQAQHLWQRLLEILEFLL